MNLLIIVQKWTMKTGSNLSPCEVLKMPPAAEPEISQAELATGTHDNLPTQIQISKITIAEADATATAKQNYQLKGDAQKDLTERFNYDYKQKKRKLKYK